MRYLMRSDAGFRPGIWLWLLLLPLASCATTGGAPPEVVPSVDLNRYMGVWYEIARFPFRVQEGCYGTTATYTLRQGGSVTVLNRCRKDSFEGKESVAEGTARIVDATTNAKLSVTFFWPFSGDYWIIELGKDYEYAVVSVPSRKYLWILSRTPIMPEAVYRGILDRLQASGFDITRVIRTPQRAM
jgi:apolipoprotein D and lipocalin family protein